MVRLFGGLRIRSEQPTIEVSLVLKQLYQIIANRLRYDENIVRHTKGRIV